ncbi:hypothetical protein EG327_008463 [Venturia inaequalis]|uniref:Uncharacterized protein n=1 Tax=Venturia inaequalis TaxID=5025 RepID=A0A8H3ZDU4_VENIN|nr:hypothetical protein EG327_008463 [Venturia inaequalis]
MYRWFGAAPQQSPLGVVGYHVGLILSMNALRACNPKAASSILAGDSYQARLVKPVPLLPF